MRPSSSLIAIAVLSSCYYGYQVRAQEDDSTTTPSSATTPQLCLVGQTYDCVELPRWADYYYCYLYSLFVPASEDGCLIQSSTSPSPSTTDGSSTASSSSSSSSSSSTSTEFTTASEPFRELIERENATASSSEVSSETTSHEDVSQLMMLLAGGSTVTDDSSEVTDDSSEITDTTVEYNSTSALY